MSYEQLVEWEAFYRLEPWGTLVDDYRFGVLAVYAAEKYRDPKKRKRLFEPADFFHRLQPQFTKEELAEIERKEKEANERLQAKQHDLRRKQRVAKQLYKERMQNGRQQSSIDGKSSDSG